MYNGILLSHKKEQNSAQIWIDLETVIQSEISQKEKNKYHIILLTCGIQKNGTDELICKEKQRHRCREQTYGYQGGKGGQDELGD